MHKFCFGYEICDSGMHVAMNKNKQPILFDSVDQAIEWRAFNPNYTWLHNDTLFWIKTDKYDGADAPPYDLSYFRILLYEGDWMLNH